MKFISSRPGSGNTMTYFMRLPRDPQGARPPNGSVIDYGGADPRAVVRPADVRPEVLPAEPVHAGQRHEPGLITNPNDAGSAFMELQFYPPGFTPF